MDNDSSILISQMLDGLNKHPFSELGIEMVLSNLAFGGHDLPVTQELKEAGKVVLAVGILPSASAGDKAVMEALENAAAFQRNVDGCILLNEDIPSQQKDSRAEDMDIPGLDILIAIEVSLRDILSPGMSGIDAETLKDVLRDCGTFIVTRGVASGEDRIEKAFQQTFHPSSYPFSKYDIKSARKLIVKALVTKSSTIPLEEAESIRYHVETISPKAIVTFGFGQSEQLEDGQLEIVMLATGMDVVF